MPNFNTESNLLMTELIKEGKMTIMSLMVSKSLSINLEDDYWVYDDDDDYEANVFWLWLHLTLF